MAERLYSNQVHSNVADYVEICVSWAVGAGGAVGAIRGRGVTGVVGGTPAGTAGIYTVTLNDRFAQLYSCRGCIAAISGAAEDLYLQLDSYNASPAATGATAVFKCMTGGVETDPAATDEVFACLVFSRSSLDP